MAKKKHYENLMKKRDNADKEGFFLEASWYAYSIIEDRLLSYLEHSGGKMNSAGKPIMMIGKKLDELKKRAKSNKLLKVELFDSKLEKAIKKWTKERNILMHAMAEGTSDVKTLTKQAALLSHNSKDLIRKLCSSARRYKKHYTKV